jgi:hypothetical protein
VNPFAYTKRHAKATTHATEEDYNAAIVAACLKEGIKVVAITDHFRIATSRNLAVRRAQTRFSSLSALLEARAAMAGPIVEPARLIIQKSSKLANVR